MSTIHQSDADALLMEAHAARFLSMSDRTLQAWRVRGIGPSYIRVGRSIRYRMSDLLKWIEENLVSTSEK